MSQLFVNNFSSGLTAGISSTDTIISISDASALGTLGVNDYYIATLSGASGIEIVKIIGISGNDLTVERGQENTLAVSFGYGDYLRINITAGTLNELKRVETDLVNTQEVDSVQKSNHVVQRYLYPITDFVHVKSTTEIDNVWGSVYDDGNYGKKYDDPLTGKTYGVYWTYNFGMPPILDPRLGSHAGVEKIPTNIMFDIPEGNPKGYNPSTGEWDLRVRSVNGKDNIFGVGNDWYSSEGDNGAVNNINGNRLLINGTVGQTTENYLELVIYGSSITLDAYAFASSKYSDQIRIFSDDTEITEIGVYVEDSFSTTVNSPLAGRYLNAGNPGKTFPLGSFGVHTVRVYYEDSVGSAFTDLYSLRIGKDDPLNSDKVIQPEQKSIINGSKYTLPKNVWNKKPNVREIGYDSSLDYGLEYWGRGETISEEIIGTQTNIDSGVDFSSPLNIFDFVYTTGDNKIHQIIDFKQDVLDATGTSTGHQAGNSSHCIWKSFDVNPIADITVGTGFVEGTVYYDELTDKAFWCIVSGDYVEENFAYRVPVNGGRTVLVAQADGTVKQSTLWMPPKAQVAGVGNITVDDRANGQHRLLFGDLGDGTGDELGIATAPHNDYESVTGIASTSSDNSTYNIWGSFSQMTGYLGPGTTVAAGYLCISGDLPSIGAPNLSGYTYKQGVIPKLVRVYGWRYSGAVTEIQNRYPSDFKIIGSNEDVAEFKDISTYDELLDVTGATISDGYSYNEYDLSTNTQKYVHVGLRITDNNGDVFYVGFGELEIYESQKPIDMFEFQELAATRHVKEYGNGDVNGTGLRDFTSQTQAIRDSTYWLDNGSDGMFGTDVYAHLTQAYGYGINGYVTDTFLNDIGFFTGYGITRSAGSATTKGSRVTHKVGDLELLREQQDWFEGVKLRHNQEMFCNLPVQSNVVQRYVNDYVSASINAIEEIHFYQPKRSPLISKADLVIGDWMIMADYVPATERGRNVIAKGTRRQSPDRDVWYDSNQTFAPSFSNPLSDHKTAQYIGVTGSTADMIDVRFPFNGSGIEACFSVGSFTGFDNALRVELSEDGGETFTLLDTAGQTALGVRVTELHLTSGQFDSTTGLWNLVDAAESSSGNNGIIVIRGCDESKNYMVRFYSTTANKDRYFVGFDVHTSIHSSEHHLEYAEPYINVLQQRHGVTMDSLLVLDQDGNTLEDYREPWRTAGMYRDAVHANRNYPAASEEIRGFKNTVYAGSLGNRNVILDWRLNTASFITKESGVYRMAYIATTDNSNFGSIGGQLAKYNTLHEAVYNLALENQPPHPKYKINRRTDLT